MMTEKLGTGRIREVIDALKESYNVDSIRKLPAEIKLDALTTTLQLPSSDLDLIIADNSPVFRTIKGHAFEIVFEYLVSEAGYWVIDVGGDQAVDLVVNGYELQLKTPTLAGTKHGIVQYKTHKTHGAKSERESMEYYHHIDHFADYLVGLISYEPLNIIILNKDELPRHRLDTDRIMSPFYIPWRNHPGLNAFERIDLEGIDLERTKHIPKDLNKEPLPKSSERLNLVSNIILDTILFDSNFRIWDMSIRGFSREVAVSNFLRCMNKIIFNSVTVRRHDTRGDKSDFAMSTEGGNYEYFQVKGVSTNNCSFSAETPVVATETQLTRGRINDHPTQSRMYLETDFDFLILCLDPPYVNLYEQAINEIELMQWKYYVIPTADLERHKDYNHRIKPIQKFDYRELQKYLATTELFERYI